MQMDRSSWIYSLAICRSCFKHLLPFCLTFPSFYACSMWHLWMILNRVWIWARNLCAPWLIGTVSGLIHYTNCDHAHVSQRLAYKENKQIPLWKDKCKHWRSELTVAKELRHWAKSPMGAAKALGAIKNNGKATSVLAKTETNLLEMESNSQNSQC